MVTINDSYTLLVYFGNPERDGNSWWWSICLNWVMKWNWCDSQVVHDAFSVAGEKDAFENMLKQYPEGIVAVVSDSYVLWPSSSLKDLKISWTNQLLRYMDSCVDFAMLQARSNVKTALKHARVTYQLMFLDFTVWWRMLCWGHLQRLREALGNRAVAKLHSKQRSAGFQTHS